MVALISFGFSNFDFAVKGNCACRAEETVVGKLDDQSLLDHHARI